MRSVIFLFVISLISGCAHTAVVKSWEPAEIDASGINRIAVVDFTGEKGSEIASALSARLWDNDFYTLVDHSEFSSEIQPASYSDHQGFHGLLASAKGAGVDAVIVGSVIQFSCEDNILSSTELDIHSYANSKSRESGAENSLLIESEEVLYREATVTIAFRLVDVETGEILASKQISKHTQGEMKLGENSLPEKGRMLDQLLTDCLDEIVHMLAPHEMTCEMKLATCDFWTKGSGHVKEGSKLASKGRWDEAKHAWDKALLENPDNHAAFFNLSIAAVRNQNYDAAEEYVLEALKIEHKACYTAGLEKVRERRSALSRANEQREARVINSNDSLWQ